jgi:transcriptional repressor NrdR
MAQDTKVIDSRLAAEGDQVRRRRECPECGERFTTYEQVELTLPRVVKRDGLIESFNENKLKSGLLRALEKRPVSTETLEKALSHIKKRLMLEGHKEIQSNFIGELVMDTLHQIDEVAYVRFASVYRSFQDVEAFHHEVKRLLDKKSPAKFSSPFNSQNDES